MSLNDYYKILGIDPGSNVTGYAIIGIDDDKLITLDIGCISVKSVKDHFERIKLIHRNVKELIISYNPNVLAIEAPYYGKNVQSMLKLGRAQGVVIAAALEYGIDVYEYAPRRVKISVTGNGRASKEQVAGMVNNILKLENNSLSFDATDAAAIALCHYYSTYSSIIPENMMNGKKNKWLKFIEENPDRII
ncbi:MAG: crossover junction endodeoxyribonuclease RuvC [Bacteroidales bacterium]|nr:crossover junction endodeoxyribonuclease RuvC [Bacteroidales bacterium]MDI9575104.1 crossover junction endodeoxyribonuclease RuvC [Bacteroidota bacterium]MDD3755239.1 crossover junction endodeoxyribonuclease RuvC [Bacteroidales bacterium]MDY0400464.1 crossover junction endodeoxyribonuclease RuvC [Bacteroidales bacterium]HHW59823.1 crossover junction endodeoxyribonuclease RuvC [Bacteroidales bacterium]